MGQFKPMVKMDTTEPSVELKLKKGGAVSKPKKMMNGGVMSGLSAAPAPVGARGGNAPVARPMAPSMAARRNAMTGRPMPAMAKGGESKKAHKGEKAKMSKLDKEIRNESEEIGRVKARLNKHENMAASKAHKGMKTGGVAKSNAGGYKTGGVVDGQGGFKKGGAAKKAYATGGAVNDSGKPVAMPKKPASKPVSNDRQSGTFKKGGKVKMAGGGQASGNGAMSDGEMTRRLLRTVGSTKEFDDMQRRILREGYDLDDPKTRRMLEKAYNDSIGPDKEEIEFAKSLRAIPGKMFRGAKKMLGFDEEDTGDGAVTETERSITVAPAKKRGGSVKC